MSMLSMAIALSLTIPVSAHVYCLGQEATLASIVERVVTEKEPEWVLVRTCVNGCGGGRSPYEEEDSVTFEWKSKGRRARVNTFKLKAEENAKDIFFRATVTAITRERYKPNHEGEALKAMVDAVEFYKNRADNGHVGSYDATFRRGRIVVLISANSSGAAQRFALHVAMSLPAT
jgi:hypothetical protein